MDWSEVRKLYPNQFVKLKILSSTINNEQEVIREVALIYPLDEKSATKELLQSKSDELVYHTYHEKIVLEVRQDIGLRRF